MKLEIINLKMIRIEEELRELRELKRVYTKHFGNGAHANGHGGRGKRKNFPIGAYKGMSITRAVRTLLKKHLPMRSHEIAFHIFGRQDVLHARAITNVLSNNHTEFTRKGRLWRLIHN